MPAVKKSGCDGQPRVECHPGDKDWKRESEYGTKSHVGTFSDSLLEEANKSGWTVISMKDDWKTVFTFEKH